MSDDTSDDPTRARKRGEEQEGGAEPHGSDPDGTESGGSDGGDSEFATLRRKVWIILAQIVVVGAFVLLLWYGIEVVLLVFSGILLAVFLHAPSRWISTVAGIPYRWCVLLVSALLILVVGLLGWWQGPRIAEEVSRLTEEVPTSMRQLRAELSETRWGEQVLNFLPSDEDSSGGGAGSEGDGAGAADGSDGGASSQSGSSGGTNGEAAQRIFRMTMTGLLNFFVVIFLGVYFAVAPTSYRHAVVRLLPPRHREHPDRAMVAVGRALGSWIVGRMVTMVFTAALVAAGLYFFGIPLVFTLALFAGLMNFVPYIGPVIGALPGVAFAWGTSPGLALQVALFYWGVQIVESFIATPLIQQKAVSIPPALLVSSQIFMGLVAGILGVLVATPLAVSVVVLIQTLYVEDVLDERVDVLGN